MRQKGSAEQTRRVRFGVVFGYGQLWPFTASVQPESGPILLMPHQISPHPIRFRSSTEGLDQVHCTNPARIRSGGAGKIKVWAKRAWYGGKPVRKNRRARFLWQNATVSPATSFPLSDSVAFFPQTARIRFGFWLTVCVRFWPNGSGPEVKPVCKNHPARFWPVLPSQSGPDQIQHVYWAVII